MSCFYLYLIKIIYIAKCNFKILIKNNVKKMILYSLNILKDKIKMKPGAASDIFSGERGII